MPKLTRESCELFSLKAKIGDKNNDTLPYESLERETIVKKKIDPPSIKNLAERLQEGDLENGIFQRVRNQFEEGLSQTLFNDRIFWLESKYIHNLDYDVKVANMTNLRN